LQQSNKVYHVKLRAEFDTPGKEKKNFLKTEQVSALNISTVLNPRLTRILIDTLRKQKVIYKPLSQTKLNLKWSMKR